MKYSISVDHNGLQWNFNYWFVKFAVLFGLLSISLPLFDYINFYAEFYWIIILLMVVLFFNQWAKARLFFKSRVTKPMAVVGISQIGFSLLLAFTPIIDYNALNASLSKRTPEYYCDHKLPASNLAYRLQRRSLAFELYLGFSKHAKNSAVIVADGRDGFRTIVFEQVSHWILENRSRLEEMEQSNMKIELSIDKHMPMREVKKLFKALRQADARQLLLSTQGWHVGLPWVLLPVCEEISQIDTTSNFPQSAPISCTELLKKKNRPSIALQGGLILYNDSVKTNSEIISALVLDIERIRDESFFNVFVDDESTYETFIQLQEAIRKAYVQIWQKEVKEQFGLTLSPQDFTPFNFDPELNEKIRVVRWKYPMNLVFGSDEEVKYFNLQPK